MADLDQEAQGSTENISASKDAELPRRTADTTDDAKNAPELSKNAWKKAQKQEKLAAEKANKSTTKSGKEIGKAEAKKAVSKTPAKKIQGTAQIGIDVAKEDDFAAWYQQVLTKGEMLDYYDVSGCYILKVGQRIRERVSMVFCRLTSRSLPHSLFGRKYNNGSTRRSKALGSKTAPSRCSSLKTFWSARRRI